MPLTNVVLRLEPFTFTTEPETKLLPLRVNVNAALPALTFAGEILESEGDGLLIASVKAPEVPPPGAGLATVIERVPAEAISPADTPAVSWVLLTNVVLRFDPFTCTTEPFTKFDPFTVSVKAPPPATVAVGDRLDNDGNGLAGLVTVKGRDPLVPPPGIDTEMERDPAVARELAGIVAVNWVLLTNVVLRFVPLARTTDVLVKFVPVAVIVTGPLPATAEDGEIAFSVGLTGVPGVIVRFSAVEIQPPPSEFATVNASCPA